MTVSYQYEVASSTSGGFTRLLFMWKGSLYKLIYRELLLFLAAFAILSALYRHAFTEEQKRLFEKVVIYCDTFINLIPLSFVLGFYVAYVAGRWWSQYMAIPWPDKLMHCIALYVTGNDEHGRMLRRTMMRYLNLTLILVLRSISSAVKRRFPTLDHLVEAGFMTSVELEMYKAVPSVEFNTYWIPCTWFINLLKETKKGNRINDSQGLKLIMEEFNDFRSKCGMLWSYDWVSLPLVYTQVVTIATYSFFLAALVGRQYVDKNNKSYQMEVDIYVPVFTILQFFFYMGLLKVAEQLINPFGDDDEDFELNWLIDRHTKVSYLGVDILMARSPPLVKDKYFDEIDLILPYTEASVAYKKKTYRGSVHDMAVPEEKHAMYLPEITEEDEERVPTPRGSVQNLKVAAVSATASAAAAAAGIWRTKQSSTQNLFKSGEAMDADTISVHHMEEGLAHPSEIKVSEVSWSYAPPKEHGLKVVKPLARSESAPGRKPSFTISQWPSSSTVCQSDSVRLSEISIDVDGSEQGVNSSQQPMLLAHEKPKHHSFSDADFHNQKPGASPFSTIIESKFSPVGRRRAFLRKIKSLPKLMPVKRQSSMGSADSHSRNRKGVRWKTVAESSAEKIMTPHAIEFERMYGRGSQSDTLAVPDKFNTLDAPEIKFTDSEFISLRSFRNPDEATYCDMCRRRIQRLSVSPNPETLSIVSGMKHSNSAPLLTDDHTETCNRDRSHSWQNKITTKMKNGAKKKEVTLSELLSKLEEVDSTFVSNSAPCLSFLDNSLLCIKSPDLEDNGLNFISLVDTPKEKIEVNSFPPSDLAAETTPIKTFLVPNPELEMDTSSPPTSRKGSDVLNDSSQDAGSWKSADWSTLLGTDLSNS